MFIIHCKLGNKTLFKYFLTYYYFLFKLSDYDKSLIFEDWTNDYIFVSVK